MPTTHSLILLLCLSLLVACGTSSPVRFYTFDTMTASFEAGQGATIVRTLTANVDALLSNALVIEFPFGGGRINPDYRVAAQVVRFDVGADGVAVLDVRWGINTAAGERVSAPRRDQYSVGANGSGYDSVVGAMRRALEAFSRDIAGALQELA
jgi:uncharacterized lipoprotein YmbA